jgi:phospholipid/cholesterol/gamma-HCH transport system permease protein
MVAISDNAASPTEQGAPGDQKPARPTFATGGDLEAMNASLSGDWTLGAAQAARDDLRLALKGARRVTLDLNEVGRLDTAGVLALLGATEGRLDLSQVQGRPDVLHLLSLVHEASGSGTMAVRPPSGAIALVRALGVRVVLTAIEIVGTVTFIGHIVVSFAGTLVHPRRLRWPALVTQIQHAGLEAIPIVVVTAFFIGAVVALLGSHMLAQFGAQVFVVDLIGLAVLREFGVIIAAVLLAGRSASAFAAELGAMRMQQEIDALEVLGVDPFEALVLPRVGALLLTMPLLTFLSVLAGLLGGLLVVWTSLDVTPAFFFQRIVGNVGATPLWVGLSKAPLMAIVIAAIGCRQGLQVGGDVQSLGRRVTAAVVHAIFAFILIDAAFALLFMALNI